MSQLRKGWRGNNWALLEKEIPAFAGIKSIVDALQKKQREIVNLALLEIEIPAYAGIKSIVDSLQKKLAVYRVLHDCK